MCGSWKMKKEFFAQTLATAETQQTEKGTTIRNTWNGRGECEKRRARMIFSIVEIYQLINAWLGHLNSALVVCQPNTPLKREKMETKTISTQLCTWSFLNVFVSPPFICCGSLSLVPFDQMYPTICAISRRVHAVQTWNLYIVSMNVVDCEHSSYFRETIRK